MEQLFMTNLEYLTLQRYLLEQDLKKVKSAASKNYEQCESSHSNSKSNKEIRAYIDAYKLEIDFNLGATCINHAYFISGKISFHGDMYHIDDILDEIGCPYCLEARNIKTHQIAPLRRKLGNVKRQLTLIAKQLQTA